MEVGDKVWCEEPRNREVSVGVITKVGRKYFYVGRYANDPSPFKVNKETMRDNTNIGYGYRCKAYLSEQELLDKREFERLFIALQMFFSGCSKKKWLTLEILRKVAALVGVK